MLTVSIDVTSPKGPRRIEGDQLPRWSVPQLEMAAEILSDPGGGLLSAMQSVGQVRAALEEADEERWAAVVGILYEAEAAGIRRQHETARRLIREAIHKLG